MEQLDLFPDERIKRYEVEVAWEETVEKRKKFVIKVPPLDNDDVLYDYVDEEIAEALYGAGVLVDRFDWEFVKCNS